MSALEGRRIAVTRAEEQAGSLCARLEAAGAIPVRCPTIRILPPESYDAMDEALWRVGEYDWLVFTSANGVRSAVGRMEELGIPRSELDRVRVAAVGSGTARALLERGVRADLVPEEGGSDALLKDLTSVKGERVLLARADLAGREAGKVLRDRGAAAVHSVVAYRTVPTALSPEAVGELSAGVDGITFTSPSTVWGFVRTGPRWRRLIGDAVVVSIGPVTTAAAREVGLDVQAEASERTMAGLVASLAGVFAGRGG